MNDLQQEFPYDFRYFLQVFRRYWFLVLGGFLLGIIGSSGYFWCVTPLFKSSVSFITWSQAAVLTAQGVQKFDEQAEGNVDELSKFNSIISQSMVMGQALVNDSKNLIENAIVKKRVMQCLGIESTTAPYEIKVTVNRQSCIVTIEAIAADPHMAQKAADTTMEVFKEEQTRLLGTSFARVIQSAELPEESFFPDWKKVFPIGIFLGFLLGAALALLWDIIDASVKNPEDIEKFDLLFLGNLSQQRDIEQHLNLEVIKDDRRNRVLLDEMQLIKTTLRHHNIENLQRSIVVTSDSPGCGKSTFAVMLSQVLANSAERVLLIDCDLRKPSLFRKLNLNPNGGLVDCLLGMAKGESPDRYIVPTSFPHVDFMSYGQTPRRPTDLLESHQLSDLLELMTKKYRYVILDSPPVHGMADAFLLTQKADGMIFVAKYGKTRLDQFRRIFKEWQQLHMKMLGVVISQKKSTFSYYGKDTP